jgi:hypothetical protein
VSCTDYYYVTVFNVTEPYHTVPADTIQSIEKVLKRSERMVRWATHQKGKHLYVALIGTFRPSFTSYSLYLTPHFDLCKRVSSRPTASIPHVQPTLSTLGYSHAGLCEMLHALSNGSNDNVSWVSWAQKSLKHMST